ncbi:MAG TPA: thioredoxin domain-containing protein [Draconibacterium sp.]|nr:thioredoxin domain-containing protein [Draconibacterium sp.]
MLKKNGYLILMIAVVAGLIIASLNKENIYELISSEVQKSTTAKEKFNAQKYIYDHFDYESNKQDFDYSILEFKSAGCTICKQMEPELEKIKTWNEERVNVVVIQIMNPDSQEMMKFYGISAVPTHIILDKKGNEFFRKYGFISAEDMRMKILTNQTN